MVISLLSKYNTKILSTHLEIQVKLLKVLTAHNKTDYLYESCTNRIPTARNSPLNSLSELEMQLKLTYASFSKKESHFNVFDNKYLIVQMRLGLQGKFPFYFKLFELLVIAQFRMSRSSGEIP